MSTRDKRRSAILSPKGGFKKEIVNVEGEKYELRQPSNKARVQLFDKCRNEAGDINMLDFLIWAVIYNTYDPDTGEQMFEDSDYDTFAGLPAGGPLDKLGETASKLLNVNTDIEKK